jgi:excisionase family DNA binding protein
MNQPEWLSITEFARRLCLSRHTVEGLVKTGGLKVFNISPGRNRPTYRIPATELETALQIMKSEQVSHGEADERSTATVRDQV